LIRWSDSGLSFVVLDEDEFAKTLIPELFKHNNYASFVRQLNMYGFHKKVGLSDNSMRASERKNKSPNEYSNPYFRRGKPNLLWLIQKPKPVSGKGKAETRGKQDDGNFDEDGDDGHDVEQPTPAAMTFDENARNPRQPLMIGAGLPQEDLAAVHRELQAIRQQQHMIHQVITKIRQEHEQLYGQAAAFQELHNRHENSINAILTFLATVYNRSLEGYGAPTLANIFPSAIPHDLQQQNSASNVVDVGDYPSANADLSNGSLRRPNRRQQLLLQAPPPANLGVEGNATTGAMATPSILSPLGTVQSPGTPYSQPNATVSPGRQTTSRDARDQNKPSRSSQSPKFSPADKDIISIINSANSSGNGVIGSRMDFPQALSHLQTANGKSPLSQNQRNSVLQLMANGSALASPNGNNALASPSPPIVPVPGIPHWHATQAELEFLERTLKEQDDKVANLSSMLQPLSPSGSIPGLSDSPGYVPPLPGDSLDFDQLFNSGDYFNEASNGGSMNFGSGTLDFNGGSDFDFDNPTGNDSTNGYGGDSENQQGGGGLDTNGREDLSPETYTKPEDVARQQEAQSPRKRRRRG
jgi:heat shock transcription factor